MEKILFIQFSNKLFENNIVTKLCEKFYTKNTEIGYYFGEHYFEIPLWIAECTNVLYKHFNCELLVCTNVDSAIEYIKESNFKYVLFSVMDINLKHVEKIMSVCVNQQFLVGGYAQLSKDYTNVIYLNSVEHLCKYLKIKYKYGLNYSLFGGEFTIPRLKMSKGCMHKCKFCEFITRNITEKSYIDILRQISAYSNLRYKLIYIDDKTFGQAKNYKLLERIYPLIKRRNPKFEGFIIQTTCALATNNKFIDSIKKGHVRFVEIGVESYNDSILKLYSKPSSVETIDKAINKLHKHGFNIIPNVIVGLKGETPKTMSRTIWFLLRNINKIFFINLFGYSNYEDENANDRIEGEFDKNGYTKKERIYFKIFYFVSCLILRYKSLIKQKIKK